MVATIPFGCWHYCCVSCLCHLESRLVQCTAHEASHLINSELKANIECSCLLLTFLIWALNTRPLICIGCLLEFKVLVLTYKALNSLTVWETTSQHVPCCYQGRPSSCWLKRGRMRVLSIRTSWLWNSLFSSIPNLLTFRAHCKAHIFLHGFGERRGRICTFRVGISIRSISHPTPFLLLHLFLSTCIFNIR